MIQNCHKDINSSLNEIIGVGSSSVNKYINTIMDDPLATGKFKWVNNSIIFKWFKYKYYDELNLSSDYKFYDDINSSDTIQLFVIKLFYYYQSF